MDEMDLLEYLRIIRKRIWMIISITAISLLSSAIISIFVLSPVYEAKVTFIIGRTPTGNSDKVQYNDILMYQKLVKTYAELAKSRLIAELALSKLDYDITPDKLRSNLTVVPKGDTNILELTYQDKSPERAVNIANTLSNVFVDNVQEMMNAEDAKIMDKAQFPKRPVKPRVMLNIAIAGFLGLMVSLGLAFLLEYLDNTIKTEDDIEKYLGITVLASIPYVDDKEKK